jgi:hypothetical protein
MGVITADIRLYDISCIQPSAQPHFDYLKIGFFLRKIIKTQHGGDFKSGQQSVCGFFIDLFYGRFDFSHQPQFHRSEISLVVNADAFVEEMQMR